MDRLTRFSLLHPRLTSALLAMVTISLLSQLPSLPAETGYRAYLGENHPTIQRLESFIEGFGGGLPMAAVWSCAETDQSESVFDPGALRMAHAVVGELRGRHEILRIESPAATTILIARGDEIRSHTLIEGGGVSAEIEILRDRAVMDPLWLGTLVSPDGKTGAIVLELASSESDDNKSALQRRRFGRATPFGSGGVPRRELT